VLIAAVTVLVLAVAGVVVAHLANSSGGSSDQAHGSGAPSAGTCADTTSIPATTTLQQAMTDAIQHRDRAAFLAVASTSTAKRLMGLWWDNAAAVGFTTGVAYIAPDDRPPISASGASVPVTLTIGLHNALDPIDPVSDVIDTPQTHAASTTYRVTLTRGGADCNHLSIASWKSLWNTPLDVPGHLYVKRTAHTVVAGEQAMKAQIDRLAPVAEKAARWDLGFFTTQQEKHKYLEQKGFVVFVPTTSQQALHWFRAPTAPKPKGWTADAGAVAGTDFPLPGVNFTGVHSSTTFDLGGSGASRVIVTAAGRNASARDLEGTLVHEFAHNLLDVNSVWVWVTGTPIPGAIIEGAARWIESYYYDNPACDCKNSQGRWPTALPHLKAQITPYLSRFSGAVPTDAQIYGASGTANYYYALAASTFDWIAGQWGASFALQTVVNDYLGQQNPFSGVVTSTKGGTVTLADPAQYQPKWASWVRGGLPA